jgi:hypothetical protein
MIVAYCPDAQAERVVVKYRGYVDLANFTCITTKSSLVNRICYEEKNEYLLVLLDDTYYHYCRVPHRVFEEWGAADSKGRYFVSYIKGRFDCRLGGVPNE